MPRLKRRDPEPADIVDFAVVRRHRDAGHLVNELDLDGRVLWGGNSAEVEAAAVEALEGFTFDEALARLRRRFSRIHHQNSVNGVRRG